MASVVRLDSLQAVYGGGHIHSLKSADEIQNGFVGHAGDLVAGERELRNFVKATTASISTTAAVLVSHDEIIYDETRMSQNNLKNFKIDAGKPFRAYDLKEGDVFAVSLDAITALAAKPVVGNKVVLANASYKLAEIASATTQRFVGKIEALETIGVQTVVGAPGLVGGVTEFAVIRVEKN